MLVASCTNAALGYLFSGKSGFMQLIHTQPPKVEMVVGQFIAPKHGGDLLPVIDKLRATRSQGRPYAGLNIGRVAAINSFHVPYGTTDDVTDTAAPS